MKPRLPTCNKMMYSLNVLVNLVPCGVRPMYVPDIRFLPPANLVCEGYVFTGVCLSTGGEGGWRTPPWMENPTPPDGEPSPGWRTPPWMENPPDGEPPTPPRWRPPRMETPLDGEPPPLSMCGRYASYWNAFLFLLWIFPAEAAEVSRQGGQIHKVLMVAISRENVHNWVNSKWKSRM